MLNVKFPAQKGGFGKNGPPTNALKRNLSIKKRITGQNGKSSKSTKPKVINMTNSVKRPSKKRKKNQKQFTWKSTKSQVITTSDVSFKSPTSIKKSVQRLSKPEANNKAKPKIRLR